MERQVTYILASDVKIIISEIDYEFVLTSRQPWYINGWGYVYRRNKTHECLHILIAQRIGLNTNNIIDHINRNKVDNSRLNLRESNPSLNQLNSKIQSNNISGTTGISYNKATGKYYVAIRRYPERIQLGSYDKKEDAIRARLLEESKIKW